MNQAPAAPEPGTTLLSPYTFMASSSVLTLAGALPLIWLAQTMIGTFLQLQLIGVLYLSMIIAFIAGSHWGFSIVQTHTFLMPLSIVNALLPWAYLGLKQWLRLEIEIVWILLTSQLMCLMYIDWSCIQNTAPKWYTQLRLWATSLITLPCLLIIYRNINT